MREPPELFPTGVVVIDAVDTYAPVKVPHSNEVEYVRDARGQAWVLKRGMLGYNSLLAEAIGFELCRLLEIPTPEPALLQSESGYLWMTKYLDLIAHWQPGLRHCVENLADVGSMLTLDLLVGNNDRHAGNILLQSLADGSSSLRAYSIDMEDSWVAPPMISARATQWKCLLSLALLPN